MALEKFASITSLYKKFSKVQQQRLDAMSAGGEMSAAEERKYQKLREELTAEVESVQFHNAKIEYLVDQLYAFNRRLTAAFLASASSRSCFSAIRFARSSRHSSDEPTQAAAIRMMVAMMLNSSINTMAEPKIPAALFPESSPTRRPANCWITVSATAPISVPTSHGRGLAGWFGITMNRKASGSSSPRTTGRWPAA